jgi:putative heme-binding domain-containing protein
MLTALVLAASARGQTSGQQEFSACAACHGLDGKGGEHAPNIATEQRVQQMSDEALLKIVANGIPSAGMPGFSALLKDNQIHAVVRYLRTLQGSGVTGKLAGNGDKGRELFFGSAKCGECHMVAGRGGFVGPELSGYGTGRGAAEVREAITDPNKNLNPRHGTVTVTMSNAKTYRGVIRNEDNFSLQIASVDGSFHLLDKAEVVKLEREPGSLMPGDYGTKLTALELDDLVNFLSRSVGGKKPDDEDEQ